jgi:3-hydroxyanthranilate 3,4-dioxygenase
MARKTAAKVSKKRPARAGAGKPRGFGDEFAEFPVVHLARWIKAHADQFRPPVSNKQIFPQSQSAIMFVSGGPNTRNDYHVNPTEELFLQIKGDIAVRVRPLDGRPPHDVIVKEGELFLLPSWVPHRPQRPAGTLGLIVEFPRGVDGQGNPQKDGLRWYCPTCDHLVHEARWVLKKIDEDLHGIMNDFWGGPEQRRTCANCGHVIERAGAITLAGGKVKAAGKRGSPRRSLRARS